MTGLGLMKPLRSQLGMSFPSWTKSAEGSESEDFPGVVRSRACQQGVAAHLFHDKRVHHVEDVPRHPHGPVLVEEGSALKAERQRRPSIGQQIKPSRP